MFADRRTFLGGLALLSSSAARAQAATPFAGDPSAPAFPPRERFPLWPGEPPGAPAKPISPNWTMNNPPPNRELWIRGVAMPEVHVFRPANPDGSSLLVIPGGGYEFLSVQNEGMDAAPRFNAERTTVFILTYRLPAEGWADRNLAPLQDAQRAMRLIRSRAGGLQIDPHRLGVLGFSAGGHLAADLSTAFDKRTYVPVDDADGLSARPAVAGLIYPVTTLQPDIGHGGSRDNLLGPNASPDLISARSPLFHVTKTMPPCFLVHAFDDTTVQVANSQRWMEACRTAGVPVEAHLFTEGGHGFGFHLARDMPASRWPELFGLWMRKHGA